MNAWDMQQLCYNGSQLVTGVSISGDLAAVSIPVCTARILWHSKIVYFLLKTVKLACERRMYGITESSDLPVCSTHKSNIATPWQSTNRHRLDEASIQ